MPFRRVLIANRGEIARRVVRTCNLMGIESVALASEADAGAPWLGEATHAVRLAGNTAVETYANRDTVLRAARDHACDAIHPGYGFLAESAAFARECESTGIAFVGPSGEQIALMGEKRQARDAFAAAGFPVLGRIDIDEPGAIDPAAYPVIIKASAGGGGIGMTLVQRPEDLVKAVERVRSTGARYFGSGDVYAERYLEHARHVEVQVIGDGAGVFHAGERDCSWQRRYQKVIEETPAPSLPGGLADRLAGAAAAAAAKLGYRSLGTIECLVDGDEFTFLEMNTRIQVEHSITEMVYGIDLVRWQLLIAAGREVPAAERAPQPNGHAIEFRIYAEDPVSHLPSPGAIDHFELPAGEGIRVETGYAAGATVPMFYDPLVAKLIVHGATREDAIHRSTSVLDEAVVTGIKTNIPLLQRVVRTEEFRSGRYDTGSLGRMRGR